MFNYEIVQHLGRLSESEGSTWAIEVNIIRYNGGAPKLDIRRWSLEERRMGKGIALSYEEAKRLKDLLPDEIIESLNK